MNGIPKSPLNRYNQVTDVVVAYNKFVDSDSPFQFGVGTNIAQAAVLPKSEIRSARPLRTEVVNNVIYNSKGDANPIIEHDKADGVAFKSNMLVMVISLTSCLDDSLPNIGDLPDFTNPTPFYNVEDVSSSEFDCNDVEISANYDFNFQAGSNLAVNGTQNQWSVSPSDGVTFINKDLPILEQAIKGELATVVALEDAIAKLEFKLPCETNPAKADVLEAQIAGLKIDLQAANDNLSETTLQNVANLEAQIAALPAASLQDRELIF